MDGALAGIKVLDLTEKVAGAFCTKFLADYGADVVKVERPNGGDPVRSMPPFFEDRPGTESSGLFLFLNTNKKSITLDLKSPSGTRLFRELVGKADLVVESFEPRVMPELGLSYADMRDIRPGIIMTSISPYGQTGPYRDYKAEPLNLMAMGGMMNITGDPKREPLTMGGMQADFMSGLYAFIATLMAVYYRDLTGTGQQVDVSQMEAIAANLERTSIGYSFLGAITHRGTSRFFNGYPWGIFPAKDGHLFIIPGAGNLPNLALMVEQPELAEHPLFTDRDLRFRNPEEFDKLIVPWLEEHDRAEIVELATDLRMPFAPVVTIDELVADDHLKERGYFKTIEHPTGTFEYPGPQFNMSETPARNGRAPLLGEQNEAVLSGELGLAKEDLVRLREEGVI